MHVRTGVHTGTQTKAEIILPAPVTVPVTCPSCDTETFAPPGTLCERCNPENVPLFHDAVPMEARCGTCRQVVTTAALRQSPDLEQMTLLCCPHCGVLWCSSNPYKSASGGVSWWAVPTTEAD